jgi:hypothetical protein
MRVLVATTKLFAAVQREIRVPLVHGVRRGRQAGRKSPMLLLDQQSNVDDGPPASACAEALDHGVHSADVVLNILARQREPAPPANIMTPAALTLRHAPIGDCARYDNLRRTI